MVDHMFKQSLKNSTPAHEVLSRSPIPLYLQVAKVLRRQIETGIWKPGDRVPSLETLSTEFGVARVTARQAITALDDEGLIWRKQGKGTFVTQNTGTRPWLDLQTHWSSLLKLIDGTSLELLNMSEDVECPSIEQKDGRKASNYQYMRRLHSKDGAPYCVISIYIDKKIYLKAPELFQQYTVLSVLDQMEDLKINRAHQILTIGTADIESAQLLKISLDAPVANVRRIVLDNNNTIIYVGDVVYRGDFVKLDINLI